MVREVGAMDFGKTRFGLGMSLVAVVLISAGCGIVEVERTLFPAQVIGPDGEPLFIEDLREVTQDTTLLPETQATTLSSVLGVENAALVDAIVEDGLDENAAATTLDSVDVGGDGNGNAANDNLDGGNFSDGLG
jgi:hypothetical protein